MIRTVAIAALLLSTTTPAVDPSPSVSAFGLECPAGTVPAWLDEEGNATGCSSNGPLATSSASSTFIVASPEATTATGDAPAAVPVAGTPSYTG